MLVPPASLSQIWQAFSHHFAGVHDGEGGRSKDECSRAEIAGKLLVSAACCVKHLTENFTRSVKFEQNKKKEKGKGPGTSDLYGKDYTINQRIFLLLEPAEIDRSNADEAKVFEGTNSHYVYEARTVPTKLSVRRYSCYCKHCSKREFKKCEHWNVWRSRKYRSQLKPDGWHEHTMTFVGEREAYALRKCSMEVRRNFIKNVNAGEDVIAVYCGQRDSIGFWLARCEASSKQSSEVVYLAKSKDDNWDIKKGEEVLNVTWLNRASESVPLEFKLHQPQTITLNSVLPQRAVWEKMNGETYHLSCNSHEQMVGWCECVRDDLIKERNKLNKEMTKAARMGDKTAAFADLPPLLQKLSTMRAYSMASYIASSAAFDAVCALRKAQSHLDDDEMPLSVLKTVANNNQSKQEKGKKKKKAGK